MATTAQEQNPAEKQPTNPTDWQPNVPTEPNAKQTMHEILEAEP
jgi:hypothetical protein